MTTKFRRLLITYEDIYRPMEAFRVFYWFGKIEAFRMSLGRNYKIAYDMRLKTTVVLMGNFD